MLKHLNQRDSLIRVLLQEPIDQVFVLLADARLECNCRSSLIPGDSLLITAKRRISMHKFEK